MELIGMALGSIVIGPYADRYGRRPTILLCLVLMTGGMLLAATASGVAILSAYRFATGIGIGGMLAATNAMTAEYANARYRDLSVIVMATGYPVGVIIGGTIASALLASYDWRSVFLFGAGVTALFLPVVWFLLPESIEYLSGRRPANALARINATLTRMGHATVSTLPDAPGDAQSGVSRLLSPPLARVTILLTVAYFAHIMTFYFILKWIPKLVVDMGFHPSEAGSVLVWANVGGASGSILLGLLTQRFSVRWLLIGALVGAAVAVTVFGQGQTTLAQLSVVGAFAGMFTNSAIVAMYAMFASSFPTELRASGTGFVIGVGRGGAAFGPILAGFMFEAELGLAAVALVMACGSLIGALAIGLLRRAS
jgi:benzoate transport